MNEATYQKLEFDEVRKVLAAYCKCRIGKHLALTLTPTTKTRLVRQWLAQVRELAAVAEAFSLPPMAGVHDIADKVRACAFPTPLEPEAVAQVAETLDATTTICAWAARVGDSAPHIAALAARIVDYGQLAAAINDCIDPRGEVRDYASDKLAAIRSTIQRARSEVRAVFDRLLRQTSLTRMLQYGGATFHNDRMVLPLKAEYHGRVPGIVHRSSDSGATLFVEPAESVELNNSIIRLKDEETKEINSILRGLCRQIDTEAKGILSTLRVIAVLDLVSAKCRYAKKWSCVCPEIDENDVLELHQARHPVLLELFEQDGQADETPREVVPIDMRLGDDFDVLVITGPNTGGKTVALKTVGLMVLMAQAGIPIPAGEGSRLPVYQRVAVDIGDEQSLQQSLSTFSSHMSNLLDILNTSGQRSLVLVDELGAGTDPDEGAAIGQAIVTELLRLKAKAVVTTHLSALKALAFTTPRVDNGSVEFDVQSLRPTYRLRLGEPGNSNALIIATRLGMAPRLVQTAKRHLDDRHRMLNQAIKGTLASRREAEQARREAREAETKAKRLREQFEQQRRDLEQARHSFDEWTKWINNLKPADEVYIRSMKRPAKIVRMQLQQQNALVTAGALDIEVPLRDLCKPDEGA